MAFDGYIVSRANVYNHMTDDSFKTYKLSKAYDKIRELIKENKVGDIITLWEDETEDSPYLVRSYFNDPYEGWTKDYDDSDIEMATFERYAMEEL